MVKDKVETREVIMFKLQYKWPAVVDWSKLQ